jgi:hypothetical protein
MAEQQPFKLSMCGFDPHPAHPAALLSGWPWQLVALESDQLPQLTR